MGVTKAQTGTGTGTARKNNNNGKTDKTNGKTKLDYKTDGKEDKASITLAEYAVSVQQLTDEQICKEMIHGQMKFTVLAAELLARHKTAPKAKSIYKKELLKIWPTWVMKEDVHSQVGGKNYEAQRCYNNLEWHYRTKKGSKKGRAFTTVLSGFFTSKNKALEAKELSISEWLELFVDELTAAEKKSLKAML